MCQDFYVIQIFLECMLHHNVVLISENASKKKYEIGTGQEKAATRKSKKLVRIENEIPLRAPCKHMQVITV